MHGIEKSWHVVNSHASSQQRYIQLCKAEIISKCHSCPIVCKTEVSQRMSNRRRLDSRGLRRDVRSCLRLQGPIETTVQVASSETSSTSRFSISLSLVLTRAKSFRQASPVCGCSFTDGYHSPARRPFEYHNYRRDHTYRRCRAITATGILRSLV